LSVAALFRALAMDRLRFDVRTALEQGLQDDEPRDAEVYDFIRGEAGNRIIRRNQGRVTWEQ
jgi:hypothetical protein